MFGLFKRRKQIEVAQAEHEAEVDLEVRTHQKEQKRVVQDTKKATDDLVKSVKDNGFTLKIYRAAGGKS